MATLRPDLGTSKSTPLPSSPNTASLSPSPRTSPGSPSTTATSAAPATLPSDEEVEAVIKQATSTQPTRDGRPPPGKDTRTQLFAGNLPYRVRWQDLKDLFRRAGTVLRADVSLTPDNRSRGYGTVLLASAEDAGRAVDMFNGYNWQGRVLEVRLDRLGNAPGTDLDSSVGAIVPGVGLSGLPPLGVVNGLVPNLGQSNGLHAPSPLPAAPFVAQQVSVGGQNINASPSLLSAASSLSGVPSIVPEDPSLSPLNSLSPSLITLQQQQQQAQQEKELLLNQGALGRSALGGLDPFSNTLGQGFGADLDREQSRSNLGIRSLFVGNLPFHCQWQDLKDLFRQAGTILRADVSLGPDGRSRGFGTVTFANETDAERAVVMFNGFDYNGRSLKVHYDKFSSQSPLPSMLSTHSSNLATPVQTAISSTQAALLQAAQLQQLVGGQADRLNNLNNFSQNSNGNNRNASPSGFTTTAQMQNLFQQPVPEPFPAQPQSRPATSSGVGTEQTRQRVSSTTSEVYVSPFSFHLPGTSPSLAERRQKVPPPIGPVSMTTSRQGSSADTGFGSNAERKNIGTASYASTASGNLLDTTPISPNKDKRSTGQSLHASSLSVPQAAATAESASSDAKRPATSSTVTTLDRTDESIRASNAATAGSPNQVSRSASTNSTSPRSCHPAHPGHISLPPPPHVGSFPLYSPHHPMSPPMHPMSPPVYAGYSSYGPMSPMHPYPVPAYMHPANMTPHGLPPITPSMPSFSFAPQPSPSGPMPVGGSSAIPPTPADGSAPGAEEYQQSGQPMDSNGNPMARVGMMPMMSPPLHLPHHVFQQFTPGTTMSPGAFHGRPNGYNAPPRGSYLNPAVGSPLLMHHSYGYAPHPGSHPGSPYYFQNTGGRPYGGEEPGGYFPPIGAPPPPLLQQQPRHEGYFPPVSALDSSGLANEILRTGGTMNAEAHGQDSEERPAHERNDSGSVPTGSENGPGDYTDAEHARSSSSGATSWQSSDDLASASGCVSANAGSETSKGTMLENLAQDIASMRLGSYAAAAATDSKRTESADNGTGYPRARHARSSGSQRPIAVQKTHSDETAGQMRLSIDGSVAGP